MERDNETFSHLLANPYHCKKNDITKTIVEKLDKVLPSLDLK